MSIARLKKVTLCGLVKEKRKFLQGLQDLGCMHLIPLRPPPAEAEKAVSPKADAAYKALRFLTNGPQKRRQVVRDPDFNVDQLVAEALDLKQQLRDTSDRRDFLVDRISTVTPWGDIFFPPREALAGHRLWFYVLPLAKCSALQKLDLPWQIVRKDNRFAYVVLIAQDEPPGDLLPVPRSHLGALPLAELLAQLEDAEVELEDLLGQRHALTRYIYLLSVNLADAENRAALAHAEVQTRDDDAIVVVQGWVPVDAIARVEVHAQDARLACLIEEPGPDDNPPTLLDDAPEMAAGVDLAMFYQVPGYRSWDPSVALFFSLSVFFAMILSDAGYGLVLIGGLLAFWRRLGSSPRGRGYRLLCLSLFSATILYGALVGSYFGVTPSEHSLLGAFHVLDMNNSQTMMKISIVIGVLHLALANGIAAYLSRNRLVALAKLGWIAGMFGALFLGLNEAGSYLHAIGLYLLIGGLATVFLFSSERALEGRPLNLVWRIMDGMKGLVAVLSMFGDVLSYLRLFALGLASGSLALTFNNLALDVKEAIPGLGLLLAILLLILGHVLNLGLSIMSGVVHGLRLNFIEFYNWGMGEEGEPFSKFARKEVLT